MVQNITGQNLTSFVFSLQIKLVHMHIPTELLKFSLNLPCQQSLEKLSAAEGVLPHLGFRT